MRSERNQSADDHTAQQRGEQVGLTTPGRPHEQRGHSSARSSQTNAGGQQLGRPAGAEGGASRPRKGQQARAQQWPRFRRRRRAHRCGRPNRRRRSNLCLVRRALDSRRLHRLRDGRSRSTGLRTDVGRNHCTCFSRNDRWNILCQSRGATDQHPMPAFPASGLVDLFDELLVRNPVGGSTIVTNNAHALSSRPRSRRTLVRTARASAAIAVRLTVMRAWNPCQSGHISPPVTHLRDRCEDPRQASTSQDRKLAICEAVWRLSPCRVFVNHRRETPKMT